MKSVGICWHGESWNSEGEDEITITSEFHGTGIDKKTNKEITIPAKLEFIPMNYQIFSRTFFNSGRVNARRPFEFSMFILIICTSVAGLDIIKPLRKAS
ncbi:MAG: hypothetical protein IH840_11865 [Candidatus Heimdallarchaeota archaeon]|nr:hypothetical protein [Candidatus Heimdallarchaeota archaeon]